MLRTATLQPSLFPGLTTEFPSTRYQGSKAKLVDWIWEQIQEIEFTACLDAFGGTGAVAHRLKREGKSVAYNDILRFNYYFGLALIENDETHLDQESVEWLLHRHSDVVYPCVVQRNFHDIYFTEAENAWIDQTITNIRKLSDPYQFALAFFALCQACIVKRPFNLFHRNNLYIRFAEVERTFGNKASWDRPFAEWFRLFVAEANEAVFDNGQDNRALNCDAADVPGTYDLVYIDTPYIPRHGAGVDYRDFYHFLEGLTMYDEWEQHIDRRSKHHRLLRQSNAWGDKKKIYSAFDNLFCRHKNSILVVSYRSDGIPSEQELIDLLANYKKQIRVEHSEQYKYVLSTNSHSKEMLLIAE